MRQEHPLHPPGPPAQRAQPFKISWLDIPGAWPAYCKSDTRIFFMQWEWIVIAAAVAAGIAAYRLIGACMQYRGRRVIQCPENLRPAGVRVDASHAGVTAIGGAPRLRLSACSRWPERAGCGQECLSQIEAAPQDCLVDHILTQWYHGKSCASCGRPFGKIDWSAQKPALLSADKISVEWSQVPAEALTETLETALPVCFACRMAGILVREHPGLVTDRSRPLSW